MQAFLNKILDKFSLTFSHRTNCFIQSNSQVWDVIYYVLYLVLQFFMQSICMFAKFM